MTHQEASLTAGQKLRFVLANEALWLLGEAAPQREAGSPGAPRQYPEWTWYVYNAAVSLYLSARKAAAELTDAWPTVIEASKKRYPDRPDMWAPTTAPSRHHWQYAKKRLRLTPVFDATLAVFEETAARQGVEMGIADPRLGSRSHPHPLNALTGDGKVITPLYKAKPNTPVVDRETGEILRHLKADATSMLHVEGGGNPVWGNKFVMLAGRRPDWHGRMIFSLGHVASKGGEAAAALDCVERIVGHLPGVQTLIYDGALRGTHVHRLLHRIGIIPVSPPTAAKAETDEQAREEKIVFIETITTKSGKQIALYARGTQLGLGDFDADGNETFVELERRSITSRKNRDGTFRWYGMYRLPDHLGGEEIRIRADTTDEDRARKINRSENYRLIPPGDPDYDRLYPLRSDIEANNRQLEDTLWINRAHSLGAKAQLLDLLGYALLYNSIGIGLARERATIAAAA